MTIDYAELIERLRVMQSEGLFRSIGMDCYVEPKEAITALEEQAARIAELEAENAALATERDEAKAHIRELLPDWVGPMLIEPMVVTKARVFLSRLNRTQALTKGSDHEG